MFEIRKERYLRAPAGESVYVFGAVCGEVLIETVRHEARKPKNSYQGGMSFYSPTIYSRLSRVDGSTWTTFDEYHEDPFHFEGFHHYGRSFVYDADHDVIGGFYCQFHYDPSRLHRERFSDEGCYTRTFRIYYETSRDMGRTWASPRQLICEGHDSDHWAPGIRYGEAGALFSGNPYFINGSIFLALAANLHDGKKFQTVLARGTWDAEANDWRWSFGDTISLDAKQSSQGACEPALATCDDGRLLVLLRACGDRENKTFPTYKYFVHSSDNGQTFTKPKILSYEDGSPVWCPSSYSQMIRSSVDGKTYLVTNILDEPAYSSSPRDPLRVAEIIPEEGVIVRDSVQTIDWNKDGVERRRYTNFGLYEDPETLELVLTLPEQPKTSWEDFTADCVRYRITNRPNLSRSRMGWTH